MENEYITFKYLVYNGKNTFCYYKKEDAVKNMNTFNKQLCEWEYRYNLYKLIAK